MQRIILIPDRIKESFEIEKKIFGKNYKIITQNKKVAEEIPLEIWQSADAILAWHEINYNNDLISLPMYLALFSVFSKPKSRVSWILFLN